MQAKPAAHLQKFAVLWSLEDFEVLRDKKKNRGNECEVTGPNT